jgi:hypothetical protein
MSQLTIGPEIIQEIREWRQKQIERHGTDRVISDTSFLSDYMNNFAYYIEKDLNPEHSYEGKIGKLDETWVEKLKRQGRNPAEDTASETRKSKTAREFYADIKEAVDYFDFDPREITGRVSGNLKEKRLSTSHRMKIFLKLREMGYNRMDLIG